MHKTAQYLHICGRVRQMLSHFTLIYDTEVVAESS